MCTKRTGVTRSPRRGFSGTDYERVSRCHRFTMQARRQTRRQDSREPRYDGGDECLLPRNKGLQVCQTSSHTPGALVFAFQWRQLVQTSVIHRYTKRDQITFAVFNDNEKWKSVDGMLPK